MSASATFSRRATLIGLASSLGGCATENMLSEKPTLGTSSSAMRDLVALPPPRARLDVAVFRFLDQTGQHKPNQNFADFSFAVTQGASNLLIEALREAGGGTWFRVLERGNVGDLLQERQIIRANRIEYAGPDKKPLPELGPLLNAGLLLEGGIVGYDTDLTTGGVGANYLAIGGNVQYRKDTVTLSLRAVSTLTGEILTSVDATKTIYSVLLDASAFKYVGFNKLLQIEMGFSNNEPVTVCVMQALQLAVYATVIEGAMSGYWSFADPAAQARLTAEYLRENPGRAIEARRVAEARAPPPPPPK